jgi:anaerobic magnesium-protoporphyrin IX monomethyl ester cyclase
MNVAFVFMNDTQVVGRGAGYIAGVIEAAGHSLDFFDSFYTPVEHIAHRIAGSTADVLMVSTMTMNFPLAATLLREVKKSKNIPVLVGGIHPTIEGARLLERHPEIDYLCIGEGESMVLDFLSRFSSEGFSDIPNLCYRKNGKVLCNPIRPAEDLSALPPFPWHLFRKESVGDGGRGFLYVTASRGCPFNCTYCCNGIYLSHYGKSYIRFRPIDRIIEELFYLKKEYSPRLFYFGDEMLLADPEYAQKLFSEVKNKIGITYGLMARVEYVTPALTSCLRETGCQYVAMGIECGDDDFRRKHLNRNHRNEQIERAFELLGDAGIFRSSFNMIGYPFDNDRSLTKATINLNRRVKPDYAYFTIIYPFPGTKLHEHCVKLNLIDNQRIEKTRQYYEESVLRNVYLKNICARISRRFNSVVPFEKLFDLKASGAGPFRIALIKTVYRGIYAAKQTLKWLLGKKIISKIRSHRID